VFINGLSNNLPEMIARRWTGREKARLWFGPMLEYHDFLSLPPTGRSYRRIAEAVMEQIGELAEQDRASRP
jgi:hypothetical protein